MLELKLGELFQTVEPETPYRPMKSQKGLPQRVTYTSTKDVPPPALQVTVDVPPCTIVVADEVIVGAAVTVQAASLVVAL